jgi:sorbitol-6-phosphate 2-dehydrogenase
MFETVALATGGFDLCISNAGVLKAGSVLEQELSDFKFVTDINYTGFFLISKYAGRLLRTQHCTAPKWKTDIIQVNSKSGLEGSNKNGAYAGGKFGGLGLVASFALELVEYGVKVNAVCPGNFLDGPLWSHPEKGLFVPFLRTSKVPGAKSIADVRTFYESKVPMKRGCTGKDLVRAIYYIVEQQYETGQAVPVTGGQVMLH